MGTESETAKTEAIFQYYEIRQSSTVLLGKIILAELIILIAHFMIADTFLLFSEAGIKGKAIMHVINVAWILLIVARWTTTYYAVSNNEISCYYGILNKSRISYDISGIQECKIQQSVFGRVFGFGTLQLINPFIPITIELKYISSPNSLATAVEKQRACMLGNKVRDKIIYKPQIA